MGRDASVPFPSLTLSHALAGGIPALMAGRKGRCRKSSLGITISRRRGTTGASRPIHHGEKRSALGHAHNGIQNIVMRPLPAPAMPPGGNPNSGQSHKKQNQGQQKGGGKSKKDQRPAFPPQQPSGSSKPGATAATLRDGTALCADFNNGKCNTRAQSCPKGVHKCSKVLRNGRPCGMSYHGAKGCRNP